MVGTSTQIQQGFINILVIGVGGYLVFRGQLSAGALVAYFTLLAIADQAISRLVEFFQNLIAAATSLQRLEQIILAARPVAGVDNPIPLPGVSREIRFEQVSFGYDPDQPVLHQIACSFPVGRSVALVGRSGSGKSTLLNLLTRLYDPIEGRVLIDGHDLRQVSQTSLYAQFGVVLQDIILLNTTICDNICLAKPEASDAEIEEAARAAEIHEAIMALPQGYQTRVGEQGKLLSPGQRQRIALARALLNKPAILLLDEATSTLDPEAEAAIQITLKKLAQHCTLIMTTHRLALAEDMDYVVVMDDGRVIEQGTPQQLLARKNLYYRMWQLQSGFVISPDGRQARITAARLRALSFCDVLDDEAVARLSEQFTAEYYEAGQIVIAQGELADKFYLIVRGKVAVTMTDAEGKTIELAVLEDGDYFGEIALLEDSPRSATVETLLPSLLLTLPREQFHQMLEKSISMNERIKNVALKRSMEVITGQ
jgi:ATP-binding cassette subfamily B protein